MAMFLISVSDFTQDLSKIHEQHADALQNLVERYRRRNVDLKTERYVPNKNCVSYCIKNFLLVTAAASGIFRLFSSNYIN